MSSPPPLPLCFPLSPADSENGRLSPVITVISGLFNAVVFWVFWGNRSWRDEKPDRRVFCFSLWHLHHRAVITLECRVWKSFTSVRTKATFSARRFFKFAEICWIKTHFDSVTFYSRWENVDELSWLSWEHFASFFRGFLWFCSSLWWIKAAWTFSQTLFTDAI